MLHIKELNLDTRKIDEASTIDMVQLFNNEDKKVAFIVEQSLPIIATAVDLITAALEKGGRVIYIGSGTGGKVAVTDATECPPTFGTDDNTIIGLISGGREALSGWREDTEDDEMMAVRDLETLAFSPKDVLIGVTASGNTPYVLAGVHYAQEIGGQTIGLCCSPGGKIEGLVELCITADVGPEAILGSTRLKAGTAQKMILNMLSSCSMIKLGKTYENLMVDVRPINKKLRQRVLTMMKIATGQEEPELISALDRAGGDTKTAILMLLRKLDKDSAVRLLTKHNGYLKKAIKDDELESNY